jgi:serine/threonine-protein kinase
LGWIAPRQAKLTMNDLIGQVVGRYRILERVGLGGMATVYKGYDPTMDRYVAIKIPREDLTRDPTFRARFTQEARTLARLEHPHILPVHDFGEDAGHFYLVMRFVDGSTLRDLMVKRRLPLAQVLRLVGQVADALAYAHRNKVIHRDIKPSNILVDPDGSALLTDFGIAKLLEAAPHLTGTGESLGTPNYMSPEQVRGQPVDGRTDIYSLGVVLYEAATGRCPFVAETPLAVALMHVTDPLPLPRRVDPAVPDAVERIILQALAKDPAHRFQSAADFAVALRAIPVEPETPAPGDVTQLAPQPFIQDRSTTRVAEPTPKRARTPAVFLAVGAVVVIIAVAAVLLRAVPPVPGPGGPALATPSVAAASGSGDGTAAALIGDTPTPTEPPPTPTLADLSPTTVAQSNEPAASPTPESNESPTPAEPSPAELPATATVTADPAYPMALHVVATIPVGPNAGPAIGVNPDTNTIYVGSSSANKVTVIDGSTNTVSTTIATGGTPDGLTVKPSANLIYVLNVQGKGLFVIDGATNAVTATLGVGPNPVGVAVDPAYDEYYVAIGGSAGHLGSIRAFDGATNALILNVGVGLNPFGVEVDPNTYTIYVSNNGDDTVSVVDGHAQRVRATVPVGPKPEALAVDPASSTVYVTNDDAGTVTVIDGATDKLAATIPVGSHPRGIAFDSDSNVLFVANSGSSSVSVIDGATRAVRTTIPVAAGASSVAICRSTHHVYVVGSNAVTVLGP